MPRSTLTIDDTRSTADTVPAVDRPEPETDRRLPGTMDATALAFVLGVVTLGGWRTVVGDPIAWGHAP